LTRRRPFHRTERLGRQVQEILAVAVQRETHETCLHTVIVTQVDVTRDLSLARVYYYLMGGDLEEVKAALARATGFLRRRVGEQITARHVPELRFHHDDGVDRGRRVEEILEGLDLEEGPE
jgi:ribosome-binding factor A